MKISIGFRYLLVGLSYPYQVGVVTDLEVLEVADAELHRKGAPGFQVRLIAGGRLLILVVLDYIIMLDLLFLYERVFIFDLLATIVVYRAIRFVSLNSQRRMFRIFYRKLLILGFLASKILGVTCVDRCIRARSYWKAFVALLLHFFLSQNMWLMYFTTTKKNYLVEMRE